MDHKHEIKITTRDKVLLAWEASMELVRDFETYSKEIEDDKEVTKIFAKFAEDEGLHAAKFRELMHKFQDK